MLSVVMLSVVRLSVVMLSVVMLSVAAPKSLIALPANIILGLKCLVLKNTATALITTVKSFTASARDGKWESEMKIY